MVLRHILRYVLEHPDAKDTLQGIRRWWLPRGGIEGNEAELEEVLKMLVARAWLTRRHTIFAQQLYGVNKEQLEEIRRFVGESDNEAEGPEA
jgi:hypothetical protein